jgi:uncharacterized membrane protein YoaK (UPF0700 family)
LQLLHLHGLPLQGWSATGSRFVPSLLAQAGFLIAFMLGGMAIASVKNPDALEPVLADLFGVAAMAVQNAAARLILASQAPTTIMTGNTAQLVIAIVDRFSPDAQMRAQASMQPATAYMAFP